jgi:4-phospho-D-threonate 3-dehydrogenase / 4-phospho-D-erythronate 3-dehydrogenase
MKPVIAITVGDYNGIGPEVTLKAIRSANIRRICTPLLVGPPEVFEKVARHLRIPVKFTPFDGGVSQGAVQIAEPPGAGTRIRFSPGRLSADAGAAAGAAIGAAVRLVLDGRARALVTAPVSKQALHLAGINTPGQTELLQRLTGSPSVAMMLVSGPFRVGLATIHTPLRSVPRELTAELLRERITVIHRALRTDWGIRSPRIAVLALNPHAGEGGDIGHEEQRVILPVIVALRGKGLRLEGPFPADAFFARYENGVYDAVIAMYHDQGLIPLKMSTRGHAVNVSVGLPIVRTSPDHGTAFNIAGRRIADPASMIEAVRTAVELASRRKEKQ